MEFETFIIDEAADTGPNGIAAYVAEIDLDAGSDTFNIDAALFGLAEIVLNERQAAIAVFELLNNLDLFLSGADCKGPGSEPSTTVSPRINDRLANPFYYMPLTICVGDMEVTYTIIPKWKPIYSRWTSRPLPREERYFTNTLAANCLKHHRLLRDGRVGDQKVKFPVNGENAHRYFTFMHSLESLQKLRIALAPYDSGFIPEIVAYERTAEKKIPFRYSRIKKPSLKVMTQKVEAVLTSARDNEADILIFPELSVDQDAFTKIRGFLAMNNAPDQIKLVVAGSFHFERDLGGYENRATMLDWQGNIVWRHHKLQRYMLRSAEIEGSPHKDVLLELFQAGPDDDLEENIHTDYPLSFADTPIGRMATLICLDYLQGRVCESVGRLNCHYLWVPAMTTSASTFESHARDIYGAKHQVLSACAASLSCCEMIGSECKDLSFLYAPSTRFNNFREHPGIRRLEDPPLIFYDLDNML